MSARAVSLALAAQLALGCSYDLEVLKGRSADAGVDRVVPVDTPVVDRPATDATPDVGTDAVAPTDAGMRAPSTGTCTLPGVTVVDAPASVNGVTIVTGTTQNGGANPFSATCAGTVDTSTKVYRYVVRSGPQLLATTNTGFCTARDTYLSASGSCATTNTTPIATTCNDDDGVNLCTGTPCAGAAFPTACTDYLSTLEYSNLVAGDVLYFAVSNYGMMSDPTRGPFRLVIAENGLPPGRYAAGDAPMYSPATRCTCASDAGVPASAEVAFPSAAMESPRDSNQLTVSGSVFGQRNIPFARITGVSAQLTLSQFAVNSNPPCNVTGGAEAALDLIIAQRVVATARLGIGRGRVGVVTIPFTSFDPPPTGTGVGISFAYRLRSINPASPSCIALDVDMNAPNTVTLYGTN